MRVLEMVVTVTPEMYLDTTQDSADILLGRLVQVMTGWWWLCVMMLVREMVVTVTPEMYLDTTQDSADILLGRLVQVMTGWWWLCVMMVVTVWYDGGDCYTRDVSRHHTGLGWYSAGETCTGNDRMVVTVCNDGGDCHTRDVSRHHTGLGWHSAG